MKKLLLIALVAAGCGVKEKSMCNYVMPENCQLMVDMSGGYAVKVGERYLFETQILFESIYRTLSVPTIYDDSCAAKAALYCYLIETGQTLVPVHHSDTLITTK